MSRQTHTTACIDCGATVTLGSKPPADGISCGAAACLTAHNARVAAHRAAATARRSAAQKTRSPRTAQPLYGDLRFIAAMNGIRTDGTGRRA